jgi:hypothetical protein
MTWVLYRKTNLVSIIEETIKMISSLETQTHKNIMVRIYYEIG